MPGDQGSSALQIRAEKRKDSETPRGMGEGAAEMMMAAWAGLSLSSVNWGVNKRKLSSQAWCEGP